MTFRAVDVYELLEPLLKDYRKLRLRNMGAYNMFLGLFSFLLITLTSAGYSLTFIDEFVNSLLTEERVCDLIMPRLIKRQVLEENGEIGPRNSRLLDALEGKSDHGSEISNGSARRSRSRSRRRSFSSRTSSEGASPYISRSPSRSRSTSTSSFHSRRRSISPDQTNIDGPT